MSLYADIEAAVQLVIAKYQEIYSDEKITFSEVWQLFQNALATIVELVEKYQGYTGEEKTAAVLQAISDLYDNVIRPLKLKPIPGFLQPVVHMALKQVLMTFAEPTINALVNIFNKSGWSGDQSPTPTIPQGEPGKPAPVPGADDNGFQPY